MQHRITATLAMLVTVFAWSAAGAHRAYEVTITNVTKGQTFTPQLIATHRANVSLFTLGAPASDELATLAEAGDTQPLTEWLMDQGPDVGGVTTVDGLLGPGESVTVVIESTVFHRHISIAAMLIPTNDTFVGLNGAALPRIRAVTYNAKAYDAGSEGNDQNCANIPGPRCGGEGSSPMPSGEESYVYVGNGFHDLGDEDESGNEILGPATYDWRNPVARITVRRM